MLYVGIDQHRKQLTVNVREESGNVILRRQVSTEWKKVRAFFDEVRDLAQSHDGYICVVEICGFNMRATARCDQAQRPLCFCSQSVTQSANKSSPRRHICALGDSGEDRSRSRTSASIARASLDSHRSVCD